MSAIIQSLEINGVWKQLSNEELILLCQSCAFNELLLLLQVNSVFRQLLQTEPRAWCCAVLTNKETLNGCKEVDNLLGGESLLLNEYIGRLPAVCQVGKINWIYNSLAQDMEIRDLLQFFTHITEFRLK